MGTTITGTSSLLGNVTLPATIDVTRVAAGLSQPLFATAPPGDSAHLFVVEKTGQIELLDLATNTLAQTPFLDLSGVVATTGEEGLLGLAFHPGYATNGRLFVYLSNAAGDTEVREYHVSADPTRADPAHSSSSGSRGGTSSSSSSGGKPIAARTRRRARSR